MIEEEGPFGEKNTRFCLRKSTVLAHFAMPKPRKPLIIAEHAYDLRGCIGGKTGQKFKADPSIQWVEFRNHAAFLPRTCEHWSYVLLPELIPDSDPKSPTFGLLNFEIDDIVNIELHKNPSHDTIPICSSSSAPVTRTVVITDERETSTPPSEGLLVPLLIRNHLNAISRSST